MNKPWHKRQGGARLVQDRAAIHASYPHLSFQINEEMGRCLLVGNVVHRSECGVPSAIEVKITFPAAYPQQEPLVYEVGGMFEHISDRHFYEDGLCCLWIKQETRWRSDDPDGLRAFLDEVMVFFDRQLVYDALPSAERKWPGPERSHGLLGYWEYAVDIVDGDEQLLRMLLPLAVGRVGNIRNKPCLCGSGTKLKHCHLDLVQKLVRSVGYQRVLDFVKMVSAEPKRKET